MNPDLEEENKKLREILKRMMDNYRMGLDACLEESSIEQEDYDSGMELYYDAYDILWPWPGDDHE